MIIIGAGGHAKVIADILIEHGETSIKFWIDNPIVSEVNGISVFKREKTTSEHLIVGIGDNLARRRIVSETKGLYSKAIHPSAIISRFTEVGHGSVCMAGTIINANCVINNHVIINTGAVIDHDAKISDFVHISPNAVLAGSVSVGEGSWIGAGSTVIQGINIGKWAIIGAGAVVIRDVPDFAVVVGNPAKIIKINQATIYKKE